MDSFTDSMVETLGKWVGDFERSIDTFAVVCVCAFALGLVFLVLLRFFVKFCVWFAIGAVLAMLCAGGGFAYIRSYQCEGAGIFETGEQTAGNVVSYAGSTLSSTLSGGGAPSEELRGLYDGNYTRIQHVTRGGRECRAWDDAVYNAANYPDSNLVPFPGLEFEELQLDYCSLRMAAEVVDAVGAAAASVFWLLAD